MIINKFKIDNLKKENLNYHYTRDPKVRPKSTDDCIDFNSKLQQNLSLQTPVRVRTKIKIRSLGWNITAHKGN
jgi:hypothetical protein